MIIFCLLFVTAPQRFEVLNLLLFCVNLGCKLIRGRLVGCDQLFLMLFGCYKVRRDAREILFHRTSSFRKFFILRFDFCHLGQKVVPMSLVFDKELMRQKPDDDESGQNDEVATASQREYRRRFLRRMKFVIGLQQRPEKKTI